METLQISISPTIIAILSTLLASAIVIILWFASRTKKLQDDQENKLLDVSLKLEASNNRLEKSIVRIEANINSSLDICKERHLKLNDDMKYDKGRLDEGLRRLHNTELQLAKLNNK